MKKLASLILAVPAMAVASHSFEMGGFYTEHKELGYFYRFGGPQFSYEVGNSRGLKVVGKVRVSNDSDLLFLQSENEFLYYIPAGEVEVIPFFGVYATQHQIYYDDPAVGVLRRAYFPIGIGVRWIKNGFIWNVKGAHLHPLVHDLTHDSGHEFAGRKFKLDTAYFVETKIGYQATPLLGAHLCANWTQDYQRNMRQWTLGLLGSLSF